MAENREIAVSVKNIHKEFVLPQSKNTSLKQSFVNIVRRNNKVVQKVLDGVSFDIYKGDFFGIVGRNGSGKSTLLKMLAGVYVSTSGDIHVNGGLTPFIELGVGFNPELSGRDNVYLNGALLGYNRKQMDVMYDEIVDFAELGPFMDQKLKNYSSGMQVRLAFSIAIKAKNEILIFDEVLAVGDEAFQRKCLDVFEKYKAEGQTIILVTHDMETVRQFCTRAVLISDGKVVELGSPRKVAEKYSRLNQKAIDIEVEGHNQTANATSAMKVELLSADKQSKQVSFKPGEEMVVRTTWPEDLKPISMGVNIFKQSGEHVTGMNTLKDRVSIKGNKIELKVRLPLKPGKYYILTEAFKSVGVRIDSNEGNERQFTVMADDIAWSGLVELGHKWEA